MTFFVYPFSINVNAVFLVVVFVANCWPKWEKLVPKQLTGAAFVSVRGHALETCTPSAYV